jgi:ABC-type transport system substrate-binding protein
MVTHPSQAQARRGVLATGDRSTASFSGAAMARPLTPRNGGGAGRVSGRRSLLAIVVAAGLLAGCETPTRVQPWRHADDPLAKAAAAEPRSAVLAPEEEDGEAWRTARDHTLRVHLDAEPPRLHPLLSPTVATRRIAMGTMFEPLLAYQPSEDGQGAGHYAPRLARSWRVASNGLEIRLELEAATFHDGHAMTSLDVQFTLDVVRDPRRGIDHLRGLLAEVEAVELITAREVRIRLRHPGGWVLRALAEIPILPMHIYNGSLGAGGALVGTGPYKLVSQKGQVVRLAKYPKYWGSPPAIPNLEFVYEPDAAKALTRAKRGELDIVPALIAAHWPEQANAPGLAAAFAPIELAPPRLRYLVFNVQSPPLDDVRVRRALALLVDRRGIAKAVYDGLWRPALWPIWPGGPAVGPASAVPEFDPAAAGKLLEAAGFRDSDGDGVRDLGGKPLRLTMLRLERERPTDAGEPPPANDIDRFLAAARRAGVAIEQKVGTEAVLEKRLGDGEFQLAMVEWRGMVDSDLRDLVGTGGALNYGRVSSPAIDRALAQLAAAVSPEERWALAPQLLRAFEDEVPLAGVVSAAPQGLAHWRLQGVRVWDGWLDLRSVSFR